MYLLGRGNARSNLVGAIDVNGGSQGASADGGMPTIEQIGDAQLQDKYCIKVRKDPSATEGETSPFKEIDGLLHLRTEGALDDNYLMIVPPPYQKLIMTCLHNTITGHMGIAKSVSSVMKHHFWWHGIYSTARQVCRTCRGCQFAKAQRRRVWHRIKRCTILGQTGVGPKYPPTMWALLQYLQKAILCWWWSCAISLNLCS